jgi:hypothetical protein
VIAREYGARSGAGKNSDKPPRTQRILFLIWQVLVIHRMDNNTDCGLAKHWGTAFEDVINEYMKLTCNLVVDCENKFYNPPGPFSYSPDGITLLPGEDGRPIPSLLEYKCPFTRVPGKVIPPEYVAQMKSGMDLLGLKQTLYTEAVFRLCRYADLDNTTSCRLDIRDTMRIPRNGPLALGFFGFYIDFPSALGKSDCKLIRNEDKDETPCLVSTLNVQELTALFCGFAAGVIKIYYSRVVLAERMISNPNILDEDCETFYRQVRPRGQILGVVPWKLFSAANHLVEHEPGFLDQWRGEAQRVIDAVEAASRQPEIYQDLFLSAWLSNTQVDGGEDDDLIVSSEESGEDDDLIVSSEESGEDKK